MGEVNCKIMFVLAVLVLTGFASCKQETPPDKVKAAGSGPTAPVAGQDVIDAMKKPMDDARQMEGALGKAAQQTAEQAKKAAQ